MNLVSLLAERARDPPWWIRVTVATVLSPSAISRGG
jgi:hypothetical protein